MADNVIRDVFSGSGTPPSGIDGGGGPPHDSDMERRIGKLEDKMDSVQDALNAIQVTLAEIKATMATKDDLSNVRVEVAEMKGRIAKLPSLAQIAALLAIAGAIFKGLSFIHT
ncbi:hypothetical protein WSS15_23360 [Acetobacter pasteurianus]|uniref:DUF1640 domain-containing protein n=1 Tax=Acetobacter pasteurianus subsp. pasteurianus TaxID=481145 RepID=A0AAC9X0V2_ACEPA|nr:hypothetical protein [Acetobacter pasteurianus]ASC05245.1 hypothetical protein S101468_00978 [Acetobacter pasteurianus subsp. pasteurianus]GLH29686.1 hypothetical protein WSS15_23360 [Acetobacter pasteurianus]